MSIPAHHHFICWATDCHAERPAVTRSMTSGSSDIKHLLTLLSNAIKGFTMGVLAASSEDLNLKIASEPHEPCLQRSSPELRTACGIAFDRSSRLSEQIGGQFLVTNFRGGPVHPVRRWKGESGDETELFSTSVPSSPLLPSRTRQVLQEACNRSSPHSTIAGIRDSMLHPKL